MGGGTNGERGEERLRGTCGEKGKRNREMQKEREDNLRAHPRAPPHTRREGVCVRERAGRGEGESRGDTQSASILYKLKKRAQSRARCTRQCASADVKLQPESRLPMRENGREWRADLGRGLCVKRRACSCVVTRHGIICTNACARAQARVHAYAHACAANGWSVPLLLSGRVRVRAGVHAGGLACVRACVRTCGWVYACGWLGRCD
eukprot:2229839-Pleurochrysis_carterae.AAC.2